MLNNLCKPSLIAFDYGETLVHETKIDHRSGYAAVLKYATSNPLSIAPERLFCEAQAVTEMFFDMQSRFAYEVPHTVLSRILYNKLQLSFDLPLTELEYVFFASAFEATALPYAADVLSYCKTHNIPTAIVSNLSISGSNLKRFLAPLFGSILPQAVLTSADYAFKKPHPALFDAVKSMCACPENTIWFVGDKPHRDVQGALNAGFCAIQVPSHRYQFDPNAIPVSDLSELLLLLKPFYTD